MNTTTPHAHELAAQATALRLKNFPIAWFAVIMGLAGLTLAWARTERLFRLDLAISPWLAALTGLVFVLLAGVYTLKVIRHADAVSAEFAHPVKLAFAPTVSIALILLASITQSGLPGLSWWLWSVGAALHLILTLYVLSAWMHRGGFEPAHLNPAWFIPVVGNILVPIAGVNHAPADLSWFFFSLGLFFWPVLSALLFYRLIFHPALPERLLPTLFIFIAPPAVGFIAYYSLVGEVDAFARILYFVALAFSLILFSQSRHVLRRRFFLSWWAYAFPIAAITLATLIMAEDSGLAFYHRLGALLLAILTLVVAGLAARTAVAVVRREICVQDG
ncbi:MAG: SLAC1 anion channel family protein [Thiobacillaceae bacterium]|nr:SLAC1 anion channel family protein [Thiobacillaceae bacterium]